MVYALCVILVAIFAPSANAAELIERFSSDITINADASLDVTETIEVAAEGREIRRGIFRDIPTTYKDRLGNRIRVQLDVVSVSRNGSPETYSVEPLRNGLRIRIGRADKFLDHGAHTFSISYRATRQLGFFENFDELYWNVTGTGWGFPIARAEAHVRLPPGAEAVRKAAYTGPRGATGADYEDWFRNGIWHFTTTAPLAPREGLTIAIAWPKGFVEEPRTGDRVGWFLQDNLATGIAIGGTLMVLIYYLVAWRRFGRDPEVGTIIPRFEPPKGLSPAAVRFIRLMHFDKSAYSAALINMAVKGYLNMQEEDDSYRLRKEPDASFESLANGERRLAKKIFGDGDSILLEQKNHKLLSKSIKRLHESLKLEYEKAYFVRNTGFFVLGMVLSLLSIIAASIAAKDPIVIVLAIMMAALAGVMVYFILHFWGDDGDPTFQAIPVGGGSRVHALAAVFRFVGFALVFGFSALSAAAMNIFQSPVQSFCFAVLGVLNVVFFFLLKKPTLAGRKIMDEIEGLRLYLSVAEEQRLKVLNPPEKTPELFERFLPYALALDVENEWNEKFEAVLAAASVDADGRGYQPRWYRGTGWRSGGRNNFGGRLSQGLGVAVVSSSTAPGSSSGSGGGGSSGGGGGGGGGGGW